MRYSFDTSVIIEGRKRYFRPDNFPKVWQRIEELIANGDIRAIENVKRELEQREGDAIHQWAISQDGLFVPVTQEIEDEASLISRTFVANRPGQGIGGADAWVIALAKVNDSTVVTDEKYKSLQNPKIPNVCDSLEIDCIHLHEFIRREGWTF